MKLKEELFQTPFPVPNDYGESALPETPSRQTSPLTRGSFRERLWMFLQNVFTIWRLGLRRFHNPIRAWRARRRLEQRRRLIYGDYPLRKVAKVDGRFFWDLLTPGYPSPALKGYFERSLNFVESFLPDPGLRAVYFSMTKRCALRCEHCYEWDNLHKPEVLGRQNLIEIVHRFQDYGTGVFFLEGGEPLLRFRDLCQMLEQKDDRSDFWIITSGYHLTPEKAKQLKTSGLTGVMVSLDHYLPEEHNRFRGHDQSFQWAIQAVVHANEAGLVTALSICTTRPFTKPENIRSYMALARRLGVSFVQWLEPLSAGRYAGKNVKLNEKQQQLLEELYFEYNTKKAYYDFPIIFYPAFHQRRLGCFGGSQYLYIDSDGYLHSCPFCQDKTAHALGFPIRDSVRLLEEKGCMRFHPAGSMEELALG